jgi:hypothetical protein
LINFNYRNEWEGKNLLDDFHGDKVNSLEIFRFSIKGKNVNESLTKNILDKR